MEKKEEKKRFHFRVNAETIELVEKYMAEANCTTQNEFIENAILFYVGHLTAQDNKKYLSSVVISTLKSIIAESENKQNGLLFKLSVELAMVMNIIAASQDVSKIELERLRGECVKEVKRLNGAFTFNDAFDWQKG